MIDVKNEKEVVKSNLSENLRRISLRIFRDLRRRKGQAKRLFMGCIFSFVKMPSRNLGLRVGRSQRIGFSQVLIPKEIYFVGYWCVEFAAS